MKKSSTSTLPAHVERYRDQLERDLLDVAAQQGLRLAIDEAQKNLNASDERLRLLADVCAVLEGGKEWERANREQSIGPNYTRKLDESLVIHPWERQERRHRFASFLGRILHLLEGDQAARTIARVTEKATASNYPQLMGLVVECAGQIGIEPVDIRIARGDESLFTVFVDKSPYLCMHERFLSGSATDSKEESPPLSLSEMRFALARQMQHIRSGHATLLQITPERLENLVLDEVPFVVRTPIKLASKAIGWSGVGGIVKQASNWLPGKSRTKRIVSTVGEILPEKDQETILPETVHDWVRGWILGVELSADRAGLCVCGSIAAACTAIVRLTSDDRDQLGHVWKTGVREVIREGQDIERSTITRLTELLRFAVSKEYLQGAA